MTNILEKQEELLNLRTRLNDIISTGEAEKRELTDVETNEMAELRTQIDTLEAEINAIEEENRNIEKENNKEVKKEIRKMNLIKLINTVV
jgi:uncharacterized protein involved in exopolysaccharide biosynthesis